MNRVAMFAMASLLSVACDNGIPRNTGLRAYMRVTSEGAQFVEKSFPVDVMGSSESTADAGAEVNGLPEVSSLLSPNNTVKQGGADKSVTAYVSPNSRTVAVWLEGDRGYWLLPVGVPSVEFAPNLETKMTLEFDLDVPVGARKLWVAAADEKKHYGPPSELTLTFVSAVPEGKMVVSLTWTNDMDLDLIVVQPDGSMVTATGLIDPSGFEIPITDDQTQPLIAVDSNQNCQIDDVRMENAVYPAKIPKGTYEVYVRQSQSCDVPQSNWTVRVFQGGKQRHAAYGAAYAWQVDLPNGGPGGPGQLALRFDIGR